MKTRRRRSTLPEGYYHVYNRAARRLKMFSDDADRSFFVFLAIRAARRFSIPIVAWCLVGNHYHFLLRGSGKALGRMLRELESLYARFFNRKVGFTGCLFQGRFGSTWLPDMEAVAFVTRYIHANSLDEGVGPEDYPWSSAGVYLGTHPEPEWMETQPVLDWIGGHEAYAAYLRARPPKRNREAGRESAQSAFVDLLETRLRARLAGREALLGETPIKVLTCWVANRHFAVRPRVLAEHYAYSSGNCVSATIGRFERRLEKLPELMTLLEECSRIGQVKT